MVRWYIQEQIVGSKRTLASRGSARAAAYLLWLYQRTMFGPVTHEDDKSLPTLNLREYGVLLPLAASCLLDRHLPKPFSAYIEKPVQRIVQQVNPAFYQGTPATSSHACCTPASEVK